MNTLVLSISYGKGCYKHIKMSESNTLYDLHKYILKIFDFDDDHLHAFFMSNRAWDIESEYGSEYNDEAEFFTKDYKLSHFKLKKDDKFLYIFDFGEEHRFSIKVLRIEIDEIKKPEIIREVGENPPQHPNYDDFYDEHINISELLNDYALSATNLYGIISQEEFVQIFNSQNEEKITIDDAFAMLLNYVHSYAGYSFFDEYIVHDCFEESDFEGVEALAKAISNKPRYIPNKEEFLNYTDEMYCDNPFMLAGLRKYLEITFGSSKKTLSLYVDIFLSLKYDKPFSEIMGLINEYGYVFPSIDEVNKFAQLFTNVQNNFRLWANKGYTPMELHDLISKNQTVPKKKIGRNDPCPCGSGKKYKKCCGK